MVRLRLIAVRELRTFLQSPVTWGILAIAWLTSGILFRQALRASGGDINVMFLTIAWPVNNIQILLIPILTMRLLAEVKRSGTFEMLVTTPVRDHEVVLGKFAASAAVQAGMWLVLPLYAVLLGMTGGNPDWGPVWSLYLGVVTVGVFFTAIGLMASATTAHQILAAFLGMMLCISALYVPQLGALLDDGSIIRSILSTGDLRRHTVDAGLGMLDLVHYTYQAVFTALFLLFAVRILEVRKWK